MEPYNHSRVLQLCLMQAYDRRELAVTKKDYNNLQTYIKLLQTARRLALASIPRDPKLARVKDPTFDRSKLILAPT